MGSPQVEILKEEGKLVSKSGLDTCLNMQSLKTYGWSINSAHNWSGGFAWVWSFPCESLCIVGLTPCSWASTRPRHQSRPRVMERCKWKSSGSSWEIFEHASKKWMCFLLIRSVRYISWRSTKQATCQLLLVQAQQFWLWEKNISRHVGHKMY